MVAARWEEVVIMLKSYIYQKPIRMVKTTRVVSRVARRVRIVMRRVRMIIRKVMS